MLLADVAAKNRHSTDAQAQGEEGLIHRTHQGVDDANLLHAAKVRHQEEGKTLLCAVHEEAVHGQNDHDEEQGDHHALGHTLQTILQALSADQNAQNDHEHHPEGHNAGACQHLGELACHLVCVQAGELSGGSHIKIVQHPACNGGVEHHQQVTADQGEVAMDMPLLARLFQHLIGPHRAFAAGTAHSKFHGHNGQTQNDQKQQVKQYKGSSAALTCHIRKFPHVANADGTACRQQDEAQPRFQRFTFHNKFVPSNNFSRPPSARKTGETSLLYHKLEENGVLFRIFPCKFLSSYIK